MHCLLEVQRYHTVCPLPHLSSHIVLSVSVQSGSFVGSQGMQVVDEDVHLNVVIVGFRLIHCWLILPRQLLLFVAI